MSSTRKRRPPKRTRTSGKVRDTAQRTPAAAEARVLVQNLAAGRAKLLAPLTGWLGSREDAEEVLHEAYLRALRTADTIRHHQQALPWFQRLLRNAAIDHVRRLGTERRMRSRWAQNEELSRSLPQELHDWPCGCIVVAFGRIRPSYAEVLRRVELNEETIPQVARDLGVTANNIRVRLHRARTALRVQLRRVCGPCMDARCLDCDCDPGRVARGFAKRASSGVSKATGVGRVLEEIGRSEHNLIAFGDAENDLPLLTLAQVGVAARGAVPALGAVADERLTQPGGAGVAQYVHRLIDRGGVAQTSERTGVSIGAAADGTPTVLSGSGLNVMISGDPRAGKSWLAGLFAEQLLAAGYRLCIIDPEGDHIALGKRPRILVLGHTVPLPAAGAVPAVLRDTRLSPVLNLASLPHSAKLAYVDEVLCALQGVRDETGIPSCIIIDEAHYFCHDASPCVCARRFDSRTGSFVFVTYRPSLVAGVIHDQVGAYLIAPTAIEAERYFMTGLLRRHGPSGLVPHDALGELERQRVGLLRLDGAGPDWRVFTPGARLSVHTHHGRKYADARLPEDRAFRFLGGNGSVIATAHSVIEFCAAVTFVGMDSLRHHLLHGDFSRSVVYGSDPIRLVDELLRVYRIAHYRRPSCFCAERPPGEGDATPGTSRDPVCGMQIAPAAAAAERVIGGERYVFCSPSCASRFDASPERYVSTGAIVADAAKSSERPAP